MKHPNSYYLSENWPQHRLVLSKEGKFEDVFRAGIRPHYLPGMETTLVEAKHLRVSIQEPSGRVLPEFDAESIEIRPLPSGALNRMMLISQPLTLEEARVEGGKWLPLMGKSLPELNRFLQEVNDNPVHYNDRDLGKYPDGFSGGWKLQDKGSIGIWYRDNYNRRVPLRLVLMINYGKSRSAADLKEEFEGRIEAPEGYEIRETKDFGPDDTAEMMYAKGIPFLPGRGLSGIDNNEVIEMPEQESENTAVVPSPMHVKKGPDFVKRVVAATAILLAVMALAIGIRRMRRQS